MTKPVQSTDQVAALLHAHEELSRLLIMLEKLSIAQRDPSLQEGMLNEILSRKQLLLDKITERQPGTLFRKTLEATTDLQAKGDEVVSQQLHQAMEANRERFSTIAANETQTQSEFQAQLHALQENLGSLHQRMKGHRAYHPIGQRTVEARFLDGKR